MLTTTRLFTSSDPTADQAFLQSVYGVDHVEVICHMEYFLMV